MAAKKSDKDKAPKKAAATKKEGASKPKSAAPKPKAAKAKAPAKGTAAKKPAKPKAAEAPEAGAPVAVAPEPKKATTRPDAAKPAKAAAKAVEAPKAEAAPKPAAAPAKPELKKAEEKKAEAAPPPPAPEPAKPKRKEVAETKPVPPPVKRPGAGPSRSAKDLLPTEEGATGFRNYKRYTAFRAPVDPGNGDVFVPEPEAEEQTTTDSTPTSEPEVGVAPAPRVVLPPPSQMPELPADYGRTFVAAIVRDPSWIYVYWEMASRSRRELGLDEGGQLIVRIHDVTGIDFAGGRTNDTISIPVGSDAENWYVNVPRAGRTYLVELGGYDEKGAFRAVATSGRIDVPMPEVSERIDPKIAPEEPEVYTQIIRLSGLGPLGGSSRGGSEEVIRVPLQKVFEGLPPGGLSSWPWPGSETARQREAGLVGQERHRSFWLEVGVDVIVYGRTEPDAKVTFMNKPIGLTPDGRFRFRFTLPNGRFDFPIEAISPDGVEMRRVNPVVARDTFGDPDESLPVT